MNHHPLKHIRRNDNRSSRDHCRVVGKRPRASTATSESSAPLGHRGGGMVAMKRPISESRGIAIGGGGQQRWLTHTGRETIQQQRGATAASEPTLGGVIVVRGRRTETHLEKVRSVSEEPMGERGAFKIEDRFGRRRSVFISEREVGEVMGFRSERGVEGGGAFQREVREVMFSDLSERLEEATPFDRRNSWEEATHFRSEIKVRGGGVFQI